MDTYIRLIKQSTRNTFKKDEYKRWRQVPLAQRSKFGLIAGLSIIPPIVVLGFVHSFVGDLLIYFGFMFLIYAPATEYFVEKLKSKYVK